GRQSNDPIAQLLRDGWKIVQDGVLQRERGAHQIETYVFGAPGFVWKLQDLQSQLRNLRAAFQANPTPELRKTILSHRQEIANTQKLIALAEAAEIAGDVPPPGKVSCSINFGYSASAAAQTTPQGVTATASANFTGTCGFTGEVYAYSYSTAQVSGAPTTQTITDGPRSGANVTASSHTSQNGGPSCTSYAYASMTSSSLSPSSYTISATNSSCPAPPSNPTPAISGPSYIYSFSGCTSWTWTASASNGTPAYTYSWTWNGSVVSTTASYTRSVCAGGIASDTFSTLGLGVTDSLGHTGSTSLSVEVEKGGSGGTGCFAASDGAVICP
ncbi:MAG TPA: hypothetical protein VGG20_16460, partial [Thermoanaerobaculia bacterium]